MWVTTHSSFVAEKKQQGQWVFGLVFDSVFNLLEFIAQNIL